MGKEFTRRLHPRSEDEGNREVMATFQIMSLENVPGAFPKDNRSDQFLTLYRQNEADEYTDPPSNMFGRREKPDIGMNHAEYHAELLARWFMRVFNFLQSAGADFHPLSPLHALINELFWGLDLTKAKKEYPGARVEDVSLLSKYLKVLHNSPMGGTHLAFMFLVYGEEDYLRELENEIGMLKEQKIRSRRR